MARFNFGGALTDFAITSPSARANAVFAQPNATGQVYAARTGGSALTDLLDSSGNPTSTVGTDANGFLNRFQGPDGYAELWVDLGGGSRFFLRAVDGYASKSALGMIVPASLALVDVQAAADQAAAEGRKLWAAGTLTTSGTLSLKCDIELGGLNYQYTGTSGTAVIFGDTSTTFFRHFGSLPLVTATAKTTLGWTQVAGTVGIDLVNTDGCGVRAPYIKNFATGMRIRGQGAGAQHTKVDVGHFDNNQVNVRYTGDATGWANNVELFGGRMSHNSNEGTQVAGVYHLVFENIPNPVNGNATFGTSLESPGVVYAHVKFDNAQNITLFHPRFENTAGSAARRIENTGNSKGNLIIGGAYSDDLTQVTTSPAQPCDVIHPLASTLHGGSSTRATLTMENIFSSNSPIVALMAAGAGTAGDDPLTKYAALLGANKFGFKRSTDTFNRAELDLQNGRFYAGDATAAPTGFIGGSASAMFVGGSVPFIPLANGSQDLGATSARWRRAFINNEIRPLSTKTANYTLVQDVDSVVVFNGTSLTATLPDPTTVVVGGRLTVKNINASALTVASAGTSKTLDGAASQSLAQWAKATYVSDGTQWLTV